MVAWTGHGRPVSYHDIAATLRERIIAGDPPPGGSLLSERDLADAIGCGRDTIRDALAELVRDGLIETTRGRPATVRRLPVRKVIALPAGAMVTARPATRPECDRYGWSLGTPVLEVRDADNDPELYPADRYALAVPPPSRQERVPPVAG